MTQIIKKTKQTLKKTNKQNLKGTLIKHDKK